jgi:hypothetical protein
VKSFHLALIALLSFGQVCAAQKCANTVHDLIKTLKDDNYFASLADFDEQEAQLLSGKIKPPRKSKKHKKEWQQPPKSCLSKLYVEAVEMLPYQERFFNLFLKKDEVRTKEDLRVMTFRKENICEQLLGQLPATCCEIKKKIRTEKKRITVLKHLVTVEKPTLINVLACSLAMHAIYPECDPYKMREETRKAWPPGRCRKNPVGAIVAYTTEKRVEIKKWQDPCSLL